MKVVRILLGVDAIIVFWIIFLITVLKEAEEVRSVKTKVFPDDFGALTDADQIEVLLDEAGLPIKEEDDDEEETAAEEETIVEEAALVNKAQGMGGEETAETDLEHWENNVCGTVKDSICHEVFVVSDLKTTFCSAAKVASTTTKTYFYKLSKSLVIPKGSTYGVHQANWIKFHMLDRQARKHVLTDEDWTHVFFWKHVLDRFISGYLDKVVHDCENNDTIKPHLAIHHYVQYGFSCEEHKDLGAFISFMETVPSFEGHFHAQTPLCSLGKYPVTDVIAADETLSDSLRGLSETLGIKHPMEDKKSSSHSTNANAKMVALFKDKPYLIERVLDMFKVDCKYIPEACNVDKLMDAIEEANR